MAVLTCTVNIRFEQKLEIYHNFSSENYRFYSCEKLQYITKACYRNVWKSICLFFLKILSKNQIPTSIKGRNSVANLRKTMIYDTNIDLVNGNVDTKFGLNRSIRFQAIDQKLTSIKGHNSVANLPKF